VGQRLSEREKAWIWARAERGVASRAIARELGRPPTAVRDFVTGRGMAPPVRVRCRWERRLSLAEREEISRGLVSGDSLRSIAARLGRAASTVCREVAVNGGRVRYRAHDADAAAWARALRPKARKLAVCVSLAVAVEDKLGLRWSPQQIAGWLAATYPGEAEMRVSHEAIYTSLFVQTRGGLRKELTRYLRTGRATRRPIGYSIYNGQGKLRDIVSIRERPAEAEDRAVPGHWEGDLIFGRGMSPVGTLVERWSRFVLLVWLPGGHSSELVTAALAAKIKTLPAQLWRSITWDQGKEMALHAQFTIDTGIQVYFCDPKSPWQRGSNKNTNGLLRQYLPHKADLRTFTETDLDAIAAQLNGRPRQTLGWMTPSQKLAEALR
jgi:IS30 family transposase